jgi:hypothetical protein
VLRQLADDRVVGGRALRQLSADAATQLQQWIAAGWVHAE